MIVFYKKYWRTAFDLALIALTVYLIMFAFSFMYKLATPVFLSFVVYLFIEPPARWLNKLGLKKSIASAISVLLFTLIILSLFLGCGYIIADQAMNLINNLPEYQKIMKSEVSSQSDWLSSKVDSLSPEMLAQFDQVVDYVTEKGRTIATDFLMLISRYLTNFSTFVFNFSIGIILAYFLSVEIKDWKKIAEEKTPNTFKVAFYFLRDNVFKGISGYLKSQLKLVSITFIVILVSLLALGVKNAFMISFVSAIFDILPLLGVATVFIPWIIYLFIVGNTALALWVTALFLVVVITRQILEPKITGNTLGVSAFTMLTFMIISLSLFGVAGVILSPILIILIKALYDQGYLSRWIRMPQGEFNSSEQETVVKQETE
ncbi:sporulation integral membrane protein YtvI [Paenibacillus xylaniclasticus]|uniref:sporulation integral membrane protein YtvI n=1 Tax=Paenibacillus xylaniclasticus TaxID=588083 RepID=UPI000FDBEF60|nr:MULTISPECIES: sporulation integral membrane protein YtvI [Paenibacillus]GFN33559.1 sporulation integral membrane protein YtvI [Paenibacillus curdlanolyticus]